MAFFIPVDLFGSYTDGWELGRKSVWDDRVQQENVTAKRIENTHNASTLDGRIADTQNKYFTNYLDAQTRERQQPGQLAVADLFNIQSVDNLAVGSDPYYRRAAQDTTQNNIIAARNYSRALARQPYGVQGGGVAGTVAQQAAAQAQAQTQTPTLDGGTFSLGSNTQTSQGQQVPAGPPSGFNLNEVGSGQVSGGQVTGQTQPQQRGPNMGMVVGGATNQFFSQSTQQPQQTVQQAPQQAMIQPPVGPELTGQNLENAIVSFGTMVQRGTPINKILQGMPSNQLAALVQHEAIPPGEYYFEAPNGLGSGVVIYPDRRYEYV